MEQSTELIIPRETVNDDTVTIVRWYHGDGSRVEAGEKVFSIETSKAVLDVEADASGYLEVILPEGSQVAVGTLVGRIHAKAMSLSSTGGAATFEPVRDAVSNSGPRFSNLAKELIEENGLDHSEFDGFGLVRAAEVRRVLARKRPVTEDGKERKAVEPAAEKDGQQEPVTSKGLFADARAAAKDRGRGIFWLVLNYFFRNYLLGLLVRAAPRGFHILLHRLRGVKIGKGSFVDPTAILETAYPEQITIGNDVRVTARAVVMAHIKGPHYLREQHFVPVEIKPVVLEDHCFIGVNSTILPGVRVGKASVVASGAVVMCDVPAFTVVAGNPAKVVKHFTDQKSNIKN